MHSCRVWHKNLLDAAIGTRLTPIARGLRARTDQYTRTPCHFWKTGVQTWHIGGVCGIRNSEKSLIADDNKTALKNVIS